MVRDRLVLVGVRRVVEVVVANGDGQPVVAAARGQALRERPRAKRTVLLESEVEVRTRLAMVVQDEHGVRHTPAHDIRPGLAGSAGWSARRTAPYAARTGASCAGVEPCMITLSTPVVRERVGDLLGAGGRGPGDRAVQPGLRDHLVGEVLELVGRRDRVEGAREPGHERVLAEPLERGRVPVVDADEQVAVPLEVRREPAHRLLEHLARAGASPRRPPCTPRPGARAGSRPAASAPALRRRHAPRHRLVGHEGVQHDRVGDLARRAPAPSGRAPP